MNTYLVTFANGWQTLQFADTQREALLKAIECYKCWYPENESGFYAASVKRLSYHLG